MQESAEKKSNVKLDQEIAVNEFSLCVVSLDFHSIPTTLLGLKDKCCISVVLRKICLPDYQLSAFFWVDRFHTHALVGTVLVPASAVRPIHRKTLHWELLYLETLAEYLSLRLTISGCSQNKNICRIFSALTEHFFIFLNYYLINYFYLPNIKNVPFHFKEDLGIAYK